MLHVRRRHGAGGDPPRQRFDHAVDVGERLGDLGGGEESADDDEAVALESAVQGIAVAAVARDVGEELVGGARWKPGVRRRGRRHPWLRNSL